MESNSGIPINKLDLNRPKLSIVIPCYNEAENIPLLIRKLKAIINDEIEVILVDNGSTDDTKEIMSNKLDIKLPLIKSVSIRNNIGYGHGIMVGVKETIGDIIAWTHADLQTEVTDVINAYKLMILNKDSEKFILKGKRIGRNPFDAFFTFGMSLLSSMMLGVKMSDINAQPKMFHRSFLEKLTDAPNDFSLDLFFLYQANINNYTILEYPVHFGQREKGESKGGGSLKGKWNLIKRTWSYMNELKEKIEK